METKIVNSAQIDQVANSLINGEIIAFKTDTIFGLSCIATNKEACKKLVAIKNRENKPLIILLQNKNELKKYVKNICSNAQKIINKFWPGPLTIIFESNYPFCDEITCKKPTIAIRVPNHTFTQNLLKKVGVPIVSTSANLSNKPALNTIEEIYNCFSGKLSYIVKEDEISQENASSTIISFENNSVKILREGTIKKEQIENIL